MNWAYLNFGPKLNLGFNQSPKSNSIQLFNLNKWAKGKMVFSHPNRLPSFMRGILVIWINLWRFKFPIKGGVG